LRRPLAAGAGVDRHRHQLCDDGALPRRPLGRARLDRHRPRRRSGARAMNGLLPHLVIAPIVLPLAVAAMLLLLEQRALRVALSFAAIAALLLIAVTLLISVSEPGAGAASVYTLGDWPAPFGIVLVLDRLSAMMVTLASALALAALVFSLARWDR